jgi:hypothetical protein
MKSLEFHPEAETEFAEAVTFYQQARDGLGDDFFNEVWDSLWLVMEQPQLFPVMWNEYGKCVLGRFPFTIFFKNGQDRVVVVAIAHTSRDADYWLNRK